MGLGNSRRGAVRNATSKARLSADMGRLPSPYPGSENGNISDDSKSTSKSKGKSRFKHTDEADFSLNRKRTGSPSVSPTKKSKKQKGTSSDGTYQLALKDTIKTARDFYSLICSVRETFILARITISFFSFSVDAVCRIYPKPHVVWCPSEEDEATKWRDIPSE
ncbi:hypothetical protein EW026_g387 [Hermanssonia centrifuga]|uniref:Uncharacterized protein n=1 Tax=Hermanssonia centrifuga TaxID=98765 RepID=A0A4S4KUZ5_9APHY|nr:hypothetical protein EW026_g387 [Hermanssonia centrifuga]